jgi:hypothetical protein
MPGRETVAGIASICGLPYCPLQHLTGTDKVKERIADSRQIMFLRTTGLGGGDEQDSPHAMLVAVRAALGTKPAWPRKVHFGANMRFQLL